MERQIPINTASVRELEELPGIGPKLANRIIQYREKTKSCFHNPEDLAKVKGVTESHARELELYIDWTCPDNQEIAEENGSPGKIRPQKSAAFWKKIGIIITAITLLAAIISAVADSFNIWEKVKPFLTISLVEQNVSCPNNFSEMAEVKVLIVPFENRGGAERHPEDYILDVLSNAPLGSDVLLGTNSTPINTQQQATKTGKDCGATFVIWGRYDIDGIIPHVESINPITTVCGSLLVNFPLQPIPSSSPNEIVLEFPTGLAYFLHSVSGRIQYTRSDFEGAIAFFNKALELEIQKKYRQEPEILYFFRGNSYFYLKNFKLAIQDWKAAAKINSSYLDAFTCQGKELANLSEFDLALDLFNSLIELGINDAINKVELGNVYDGRAYIWYTRKEYDKALLDYDEALNLDPYNAWAYIDRANIHLLKGNIGLAMHDFDKAIQIDPLHASKLTVTMANHLKDVGKNDLAIHYFNKAVETDVSNPIAYLHRGNFYMRSNDLDKAVEDYSKAISLDENLAEAYRHRGDITKLNNPQQAKVDLKRYLELVPNADDREVVLATIGEIDSGFIEFPYSPISPISPVR